MLTVAEQASIIHQEDALQGFCNAAQAPPPEADPDAAVPLVLPGRG